LSEQLTKFDELELDLGCYQLRRNGNVLKLEKAPMELLILLVAKKGQLVSREEIIEKLWGRNVFVDSEHGVNTAIRKVRQVLNDDREQPRFIETIVGRATVLLRRSRWFRPGLPRNSFRKTRHLAGRMAIRAVYNRRNWLLRNCSKEKCHANKPRTTRKRWSVRLEQSDTLPF